jgi:hypothetical protein
MTKSDAPASPPCPAGSSRIATDFANGSLEQDHAKRNVKSVSIMRSNKELEHLQPAQSG